MIVGIDVGTQSLKTVITDEQLRPLGEASVAYAPRYPRPGWAEQPAEVWEQALAPAIGDALEAAGVEASRVSALGICGQLDGCLPIGPNGEPLGPCLIWSDRRAEAYVPDAPAPELMRRTGVVPDATHMGPKIRYLKTATSLGGTARGFHQPVSYLVLQLTGESVIDAALASTTMLCGLESRRFEPDLLAACETDERELPRIGLAAEQAGTLNTRGAELTGLPRGVAVAVGTGDDFSNPLGAGIVQPGRVVCSAGTAEVVGALHGQSLVDDVRMLVETHRYPGDLFFLENPGWLSGGAITWLCGVLGLNSATELSRLAADAPAGADGLLFLPALSGAMAPEWVSGARGAFYGMAPGHGREHFCRALLEGCAFAMRDVVDHLAALGVATDTITMVGGGAGSQVWGQIRADVSGRDVEQRLRHDTSPMGAAVLATVAAGHYRDVAAAVANMESESRTLSPRAAEHELLENRYRAYHRLFESLRPMFGGAR